MKISVVLPNVTGREAQLERTLQAYRDNTPIKPEFVIAKNYGGAGQAWGYGLDRATGDYIMLGIDDCEPQPGWLDAAIETIDREKSIPAACMIFPDGRIDGFGSMGGGMHLPPAPDWTPCRQSGIWMASRATFEEVGKPLPIHYYSDDDWFWRAALRGYRVFVRTGFRFIHRHIADGANQFVVDHSLQYRATFLQHCTELTA